MMAVVAVVGRKSGKLGTEPMVETVAMVLLHQLQAHLLFTQAAAVVGLEVQRLDLADRVVAAMQPLGFQRQDQVAQMG